MTGNPNTPHTARILSTSVGTNRASFGAWDWTLFSMVGLIWGSSFVLIDAGLEAFGPGLITWLRIGSGAAILFLFPSSRNSIDREDWPRLIFISFVWVGIPFTLFPIAQQYINSAIAGMLNGAVPLFAAIIMSLMLKQLPGRNHQLGIAIGFGGVIAISWPSLGESASAAGGILLTVLATACYGLAVNIATPISQKYGSVPIMARMLLLATLWTMPYGVYDLIFSSEWSLGSFVAVEVLGLVGTGIAFGLMAALVSRVGPTRASFITYIVPVVALFLGVIFRDDQVERLALLGVVLVIIGAFLASRRDQPKENLSLPKGIPEQS